MAVETETLMPRPRKHEAELEAGPEPKRRGRPRNPDKAPSTRRVMAYAERMGPGAKRVWITAEEGRAIETAAAQLNSEPLRQLAQRFAGRKKDPTQD